MKNKRNQTIKTEEWRALPVDERLVHALVKGIDTYLNRPCRSFNLLSSRY